MNKAKIVIKKFLTGLNPINMVFALLGGIILAFTIRNIHTISPVTEGGMLGLVLLIDHWFHISPSITTPIFNILCYLFAFKVLGKNFIVYSLFAIAGFSGFLQVFLLFPPIIPDVATMPLVASLLGGLGVGVSCGLCIIANSAPTSDDAVVLALNAKLKIRITWIYLISDLIVLGLSLTYISWKLILYSLLTVIISGQLVGLIQWLDKRLEKSYKEKEIPLKSLTN